MCVCGVRADEWVNEMGCNSTLNRVYSICNWILQLPWCLLLKRNLSLNNHWVCENVFQSFMHVWKKDLVLERAYKISTVHTSCVIQPKGCTLQCDVLLLKWDMAAISDRSYRAFEDHRNKWAALTKRMLTLINFIAAGRVCLWTKCENQRNERGGGVYRGTLVLKRPEYEAKMFKH